MNSGCRLSYSVGVEDSTHSSDTPCGAKMLGEARFALRRARGVGSVPPPLEDVVVTKIAACALVILRLAGLTSTWGLGKVVIVPLDGFLALGTAMWPQHRRIFSPEVRSERSVAAKATFSGGETLFSRIFNWGGTLSSGVLVIELSSPTPEGTVFVSPVVTMSIFFGLGRSVVEVLTCWRKVGEVGSSHIWW